MTDRSDKTRRRQATLASLCAICWAGSAAAQAPPALSQITVSPATSTPIARPAGPAGVPVAQPARSYVSPEAEQATQTGYNTDPNAALQRYVPPLASQINNGQVALPIQGLPPQRVGGTAAGASADAAKTVTGFAPTLSDEDLERLLQEKTGPSLPDATLGAHEGQAAMEGELRREKAVLALRSEVDKDLLGVLAQEQEIRIAREKGKKPLAIMSDGSAGTPPAAEPKGPAKDSDIAGITGDGDRSAKPVPVVYEIGGIGRSLTASVLIPYEGDRQDVRVGSRLPPDLTVVDIEPSVVLVADSSGHRMALPTGRSVPANAPQRRRTADQASLSAPAGTAQ